MEIITTDILVGYLQKDKRLFEQILPELVKRLILSECDPETVRIPGNNDVWIPGFDGVVKLSKKTKHVDRGTSFWEFGTQKDYYKKISEDYNKRSSETNEKTREKAALYLVTPRVWTRKETIVEWESKHNDWRKVIIIDGVVLQEWINSEPAVAAWLMGKFANYNIDFSTIDIAWERVSNYTSPSFSPSMFLYDRDRNIRELVSECKCHKVLKIKSEFALDALGFAITALQSDKYLRETVIVVNDYKTYVDISKAVSNKIILLNFRCNEIFYGNNHTIVCYGKEALSINEDITLASRRRRQFELALKDMGVSQSDSSDYYRKTHGNLRALLRLIPGQANFPAPEWIKEQDLNLLYPLLFLESFNKCDDRELVEAISNTKYELVEEKYKQLARLEDSPVKMVKDYFVIINFEEVWEFLSPAPEDVMFQRYVELIKSDLLKKPQYQISYRRHISVVQQLLTKLVWYSYEHSESRLFEKTIKELLDLRASSKNLIYENLHIIAEASPDAVLDMIEDDINDPDNYIYYAFKNNKYNAILMALEELTVNEETSYQACMVLYRLAKLDHKYFYSNNPYSSLVSTLVLLNTYSALSIEDKKLLIKKFVKEDPIWGGKFASDVIVSDHYYRCERLGKKEKSVYETLTYGAYYDAIYDLANFIIFQCNKAGYIEPVIDLLNHYWLYTPERFRTLADIFMPESFKEEEIIRTNHMLRKKSCLLDKNESRKGYSETIAYWIAKTTVDDPILQFAWAFFEYYNCPDLSLVDCYAGLDKGKIQAFRVNLISSVKRKNKEVSFVKLIDYMDNAYGWGKTFCDVADQEDMRSICERAYELKKHLLLAGCLDCLNIELFQSFIDKISAEDRKSVLPYIHRKDLSKDLLAKEDLMAYWSNKIMDGFDDNEYHNMLMYNPYGLLLYCDKETEDNAEFMISTVNEVFSAIATFQSGEANQRNYLIEQIIYKIDRVYYSYDWVLLCIKLQDLGLIDNNSEGINRYYFSEPDLLIKKNNESMGFYNKFKLPDYAYSHYSELKNFIVFLIDSDSRHLASKIIGLSFNSKDGFPAPVMDCIEEISDIDFDKEIAGSIALKDGFSWLSDGTEQRHIASEYAEMSKRIAFDHYHTRVICSTLSKIYLRESDREDLYGELYY